MSAEVRAAATIISQIKGARGIASVAIDVNQAEVAISALKKQIPLNIGEVYQARINDMPGKCILSGNCPVCGSPVPKKHWYCWSCGQRLKWSLGEESGLELEEE